LVLERTREWNVAGVVCGKIREYESKRGRLTVEECVVSCVLRPAPGASLFPYTTLFRSPCSAWNGPAKSPSSGPTPRASGSATRRSEEHTSELQSPYELVCRLLLEKKTYRDARLRGRGPATPSQTAWALMGYVAAGDASS